MKLKEQIIRELFQSEMPESASNVMATFKKFSVLMGWENFRILLMEYNFKRLPKHLGMFQRTTRRNQKMSM
jgi:hypothetical protein